MSGNQRDDQDLANTPLLAPVDEGGAASSPAAPCWVRRAWPGPPGWPASVP